MKKNILSVLLIVSLLLVFIPSAQADFSQTYYSLRFSSGYAVYTGPGSNYHRANGNAFYGGGVVRYYGTEPGGWLMIGYQTSGGQWRMGYIQPESASKITTNAADYTLFSITFTSTVNYTNKNTFITDDPLYGDMTPLTDLLAGQMVTVLGRYNDYWVYVEVSKPGMKPMRGYVQSTSLTTTVPSVTPTYLPTNVPVVTPPPTAAPTAPPSGTPYLSSLTHNAPNTGIMVPSAFSPGQTSYLLTVADWVSRVYFIPVSPNATIYLNGAMVASGAKTANITLSDKPTSAVFTLVGSGGTTTYTVYIQRRPSERRTRVSAGYIDSVYSSGSENHIRADLVTVTYTQGTNLSKFVNETYYLYDYACADDAIFYYGTMQNPIRAISFSDFISHYNLYGSTLYRIIYIEDKIVAVMPYNSDYASP